jgi:hypothetical protein
MGISFRGSVETLFLFFFFSFIVVLSWDTLWYLHRFLQCINYFILEFTPSTAPIIPLYSWDSFNRYHFFAFTYMCAHFLHYVHPPISCPHHLPFPASANPCPWAVPVSPSYSAISQMRKDKKKNITFLFV